MKTIAFLPSWEVSSYHLPFLGAFQGAFLAYLVAFLALAFSSTATAFAFVSVSSTIVVAAVFASSLPRSIVGASLGLEQPFLASLEQPLLVALELAFLVPSLVEALVVSSFVVTMAYLHPFSFYGPFVVAGPSSCVGFSASSSVVVAAQPSYVACDLLPSSTAVSTSYDAVLG